MPNVETWTSEDRPASSGWWGGRCLEWAMWDCRISLSEHKTNQNICFNDTFSQKILQHLFFYGTFAAHFVSTHSAWLWGRVTGNPRGLRLYLLCQTKRSVTIKPSYRNLPVEGHAVLVIKRQVSTEQSEEEHTHTPNICLEVTHHTARV